MTPETHDDGFHEIQLTGKQLVFLFMAATVVSVVIFLCGVLVGRGVRLEQLAVAASPQVTDEASDPGTRQLRSNQSSTPLPALPPADPAAAPPPVVNERVDPPPASARQADSPPAAAMPAAEAPKPEPTPAPAPPPAPAPSVSAPKPPPPPPSPPATARPTATQASAVSTAKTAAQTSAPAAGPGGWQVQVAAYDARGDAEAHVRRLGTKGYKAYVATPAGTSNVFRVRVGPFPNKAAADAISARLSKEERITPWVTR